LPEGLQESELFGHEKGAFTGAAYQRKGKIEWADGGNVFPGRDRGMDRLTQAKLLRVLQTREISRIGGGLRFSFDFRAVAATNRDLDKMAPKEPFLPIFWIVP